MSKLPSRLTVGADGRGSLERRRALHFVRRPGKAAAPGALVVIPADASTSYAVFEGDPTSSAPDDEQGPVYSAGPTGPLAVPTGRVLVRLAAPLRPEDRRVEFANAGFEIERVLPYAPHSAWLRPAKGGVVAALSGLEALGHVPGAEHVEPQVLMERAPRR